MKTKAPLLSAIAILALFATADVASARPQDSRHPDPRGSSSCFDSRPSSHRRHDGRRRPYRVEYVPPFAYYPGPVCYYPPPPPPPPTYYPPVVCHPPPRVVYPARPSVNLVFSF
jgi:hypothetical protein